MAKDEANDIADIVIVGGGLAGLSAAHELKKHDPELRVVVLEAKDRLGGRTLTVSLKTATGEDNFDIGGQWVASSHKCLLALLKEFNLETFPQYTTGRKFVQVGNRGITSYTGAIPSLTLLQLLDLERSFRKMKKVASDFPVADPYEYPGSEDLDSMTLATYRDKLLWTETACRLMDVSIEAVLGVSPAHLSALHFLMYMSSAGGFRELVETTPGCAQELRVKGGTQQISDHLAKSVDCVLLNHPVIAIQHVDSMVHVKASTGKTFICQKVIVAIPFRLNDRIEYCPPLPMTHQYLCRHMFVGNFIKFVAVYDKAFWRDKGFSGEIVNEGLHANGDMDPLDIVFDATSANGSPALVGFLSAERSYIWSEKEPEVRKRAVLDCMAQFLGDEVLCPISYIEKNWYLEPYNGGCPASVCSPGVMHMYHHIRQPHGSIHFAGTETATSWIGYMEGAVSSGRRVALEILSKIRPGVLTSEEMEEVKRSKVVRRKSQIMRRKHHVLRYTFGLSLLAIGIIIFKKMYFRILI